MHEACQNKGLSKQSSRLLTKARQDLVMLMGCGIQDLSSEVPFYAQ